MKVGILKNNKNIKQIYYGSLIKNKSYYNTYAVYYAHIMHYNCM